MLIENKIESEENNIQSTQIPILLSLPEQPDKHPYFFIKWSRTDKKYRISTSFKFLHKKYKLRINIIRNFSHLSDSNIKFLYSTVVKQRMPTRKINYENKDHNLGFYHWIDPKEKGEIFLFERRFGKEFNQTLVFFSLEYWNVNEYLEIVREEQD